jgi:putative transposase
MVEEPSAYSWSSYSINALGIKSDLPTPHPEYLALGQTQDERLNNYRELFRAPIETELLTEIRENINKGLALGHEQFITQRENLTKKRVTARKAGRPKKDNQVIDNAQDNQLILL